MKEREKEMSEREKLFRANARITDRLIDLRDQLMETHNSEVRQDIQNRIDILQDMIFYNQEQISVMDGILDD